jgi:hypothetical protein
MSGEGLSNPYLVIQARINQGLQSDGYGAYDHIGGPKLVHAACWAHARRKFFDAVKLNPKDTTSIQIVAQMDELFEIDAQARQEGLSLIDRHVLRLQKSKPLPDTIIIITDDRHDSVRSTLRHSK